MIREIVALACVVVALAGCSPPEEPARDEPTPVPRDSGLRTVSLPYGDGLPYVAAETAAQGICQALSPEAWRELLGGPVGRTVEDDTCVVAGVDVTLRLRTRELAPDPDAEAVTIAGHRVRLGDGAAATALLPVGEQDMDAQVLSRTLPVFHVEGPEEVVREAVAAVLPVLVHDGPRVPAPDAHGEVPFTPTRPVPGVRLIDLPAPVQGLLLCTVVQAATGIPAEQVHVGSGGGCEAGDTTAVVLPGYVLGEPTETAAGLPATVEDDVVHVELPDGGALRVRGDLAFAGQVVGALGDL